eukprot:UN24196
MQTSPDTPITLTFSVKAGSFLNMVRDSSLLKNLNSNFQK